MKKHKLTKSIVAATIATAAGLAIAVPSYAGGGAGDIAIVKAIQVFNGHFDAALQMYLKSASYTIPAMLNEQKSNIVKDSTAPVTSTNALNLTSATIADKLKAIPYSILSTDTNDPDYQKITDTLKTEGNTVNYYTIGLPASDTLYYNNPNANYSQYTSGINGVSIDKPKVNYDAAFNFGSIVTPMAYTQTQSVLAQDYLAFLTHSYKYPGKGETPIEYNLVRSTLENLKSHPDKQYELLNKLITNPVYQNYQLQLRSDQATKSVVQNNFNYLIAERTVIPNLGAKAGITDASGQPVKDASQLQIEDYIANHRTRDPSWYKQIQAAPPAAVQREMLMVLTEIESQNFQAHLDRERLLATISASQAQNNNAEDQLLQAKALNVNKVIDSLTGHKPAQPEGSTPTPIQPIKPGSQ